MHLSKTGDYATMSAIPAAYKLLLLIFFPSLFLFDILLLGAFLSASPSDGKSIRQSSQGLELCHRDHNSLSYKMKSVLGNVV